MGGTPMSKSVKKPELPIGICMASIFRREEFYVGLAEVLPGVY
jgi:hypothetical protein